MDLTHHSQPSSPLQLFHITLFHSSNNNISIITIATIGILATAFLLIGYYVFVIKCCFGYNQTNLSSDFFSFEELEAQKGLEEYVIRSIPIIKFQNVVKQRTESEPGSSEPDPDSSSYECAVCLNEFDDGEKLRVIPICCHAFHIDCIDIWLQTNASCPLCRKRITPGSVLVPNNGLSVFSRDSSRNPNGVRKEDDGFVVIEINGNNMDEPRLVCNSNDCEGVKKIKMEKMGSIGDEWIDIRRNNDEEFRVDQPMRRSISMDLSIDREFLTEIQRSCSDAIAQEKFCSNNKVRKCIFSFGYGGTSIKPTIQR